MKRKSFALLIVALVLQGRGNGCDNAGDFSNWRVEVKGEKARYAFHGKLTRPGSNR